MFNKLHIGEIIKSGHRSLIKHIDGHKESIFSKVFLFDILPGLISVLLLLMTDFPQILSGLSSDILAGLSLFSGLLFSLIVVIVDKAKSRKASMISCENEEEINYLKKYVNYSEQLVAQISLSIFYSFLIIILLILSLIKLNTSLIPESFISYFSLIGVFLICYFAIQFFILLLIIISGMYSVFIDDIER